MKEVIKKIDAAVRVLNNIEVKQKLLKEKKKNNIYP